MTKIRHVLNLSDYILKRNGVPIGHNRSLLNNLKRSSGASTNADFWRHWNPIWGYYLGKGVYVPLQRWVPKSVALLIAFAISGALHDLAIGLVKNWQCFFYHLVYFDGPLLAFIKETADQLLSVSFFHTNGNQYSIFECLFSCGQGA
ncbi:MAG TPA: acyltransferase [Gemmatimonadetes bacterium]|nr:acyltransferase [Gemmatimonadota bacterium]